MKEKYYLLTKRIQLINRINPANRAIVTANTVIESSAANGINLVEEDYARLLRSGHLEEFTDHARTLADILLNQLAAYHSDEAGVRAVGDCSGKKGLPSYRRTVAEDSLGRINTKLDELFRVKQWEAQQLHASSQSVPCSHMVLE